ncbi:MAG: ATP synthase F1 subunit epsilon [Lachnospirales bacterium]
MADKKIHLRLVSPTRLVYSADVDMVILRAVSGDIGILYGHENLTTILGMGLLRIITGETEEVISVLGGFCEVTKDSVTILSDAAELPSEIDEERAEHAKERAEKRLSDANGDLDVQRAELALRRALVRLEAVARRKV